MSADWNLTVETHSNLFAVLWPCRSAEYADGKETRPSSSCVLSGGKFSITFSPCDEPERCITRNIAEGTTRRLADAIGADLCAILVLLAARHTAKAQRAWPTADGIRAAILALHPFIEGVEDKGDRQTVTGRGLPGFNVHVRPWRSA